MHTSDDPGYRAPGASEEENINADESDRGLLRGKIRGTSNSSSDGDDVLTHAHSDGTHKKQVTASKTLNHVETRECRGDVDTVGDDLDNEGVLETSILKVLCSVVWILLGYILGRPENFESLQKIKLTPVNC